MGLRSKAEVSSSHCRHPAPPGVYLHDVFSGTHPAASSPLACCVATTLSCCCILQTAVYHTGILCQACPSVGQAGQEGSLLPSLMTPGCSSRSQDLSSIFRSQGAQDMAFSDWGACDVIPEAHLVRVCFLRPGPAFPQHEQRTLSLTFQ